MGRFPDACAGTGPESNAAPTAAPATASADDQFQKTLETAFGQLESKSLLAAAPLVELAACDGLVVGPSKLASIMGVPSLDGLTMNKPQFMSLATEMKTRFGVEKVAELLGKDAFIGTGGMPSAAEATRDNAATKIQAQYRGNVGRSKVGAKLKIKRKKTNKSSAPTVEEEEEEAAVAAVEESAAAGAGQPIGVGTLPADLSHLALN